MRAVPLLLAVLLAPSFARAQQSEPVTPGDSLLRVIHDRYAETRFRSVYFLQKTTYPDGRVEWWYEAEGIPGKARVDYAPFSDRRASIFRNDSAYVFRDGALERTGAGLAATMWLLMDMYAVPPEQTAAALSRRGFDLAKAHEHAHEGRRTIVVGALPGDTLSPQFWVDAEHLYTVRIVTARGGHVRTDVGRHVNVAGGWIEREIRVYRNGELALLEEYHDVTPNVALPTGFFEPDLYRAPPWTERHPVRAGG